MACLALTLLGGFEARLAAGPPLSLPAKGQALLAYLALRPGQDHPRDKLAALLWGDSPQAQARDSLRHTVTSLTRALAEGGSPALVRAPPGFSLDPASIDTDVAAFERGVAEGSPDAIERAVALYRGDLLEGLAVSEAPFEEWLLGERARLRELAADALAALLAHRTRAGSTELAIQTAGRLISLEPIQEPVHRTLMRLYARQGRRGAALRQYQRCVAVLQRELGVEPEPESRQLYQEILQRRRSGPGTDPEDTRQARAEPVAAGLDVAIHATPLIGREAEHARLRQALDESRQGHARVAAVLGEAGIGKSRLLEALATEAIQRGSRLLLGRCYESGQVLPFAPWVDAFRSGAVIAAEEVLSALNPVWRAELARVLPEVGRPGLPAPSDDALRLFEAVAQLVHHVAARRPLVLALEDAHWADEMSVRLLAFLARKLRTAAVLIIVTAREEDLASAPVLRRVLDELEREPHFFTVTLPPLSQADTVALVRTLARAGSDEATVTELAREAWTVSDGNPLIVLETMRASRADSGPGEPGGLRVPPRVWDLVVSRLDRLGAAGRELVKVAAVIGRDFEFALLQQASGLGDREATGAVEELVRRRVLQSVGERFDFTHERIREVAYQGLLLPGRRLLHQAVGRALETLEAGRLDEVSDRLAHHYARAEEPDKAAEYLCRFAEQAARRYALAVAVTALEEAFDHAGRLPASQRDRRSVEVVLRLAHTLYFMGRNDRALELLLREGQRLERLEDPTLAGPYWFLLSRSFSHKGDRERTSGCARRALEEAQRCGDEATMGKAHQALSHEAYWSGALRDGVAHGRLAVSRLERAGEPWWLGFAHWTTALSLTLMGEFAPALEAAERARAIGESIGDLRLENYGLWAGGWIRAARGEWQAGIDACRRAVARAPDPATTVNAMAALGYAYVEAADHAQAIPQLEEAIARIVRFGVRHAQGLFTAILAEAHRMAGELDRAHAEAILALGISQEVGHRYAAGWAQRTLGRIALARDGPPAETHLADALETFESIHARFEAARTRMDLAQLARARGDGAAAAAHVAAALELFTAMNVPRWVERADEVAEAPGVALPAVVG